MLRRIKCFGVFQKGFFSSLSARSTGGFFSNIYFVNLVELQKVRLTKVWGSSMTGSPWNSQHSDLFMCQLGFRFFCPSTGSHAWTSALETGGFLYSPVYLAGSLLPFTHGSSELLIYQFCSAFHLLGQNDNFQAPYMLHWKLL